MVLKTVFVKNDLEAYTLNLTNSRVSIESIMCRILCLPLFYPLWFQSFLVHHFPIMSEICLLLSLFLKNVHI